MQILDVTWRLGQQDLVPDWWGSELSDPTECTCGCPSRTAEEEASLGPDGWGRLRVLFDHTDLEMPVSSVRGDAEKVHGGRGLELPDGGGYGEAKQEMRSSHYREEEELCW